MRSRDWERCSKGKRRKVSWRDAAASSPDCQTRLALRSIYTPGRFYLYPCTSNVMRSASMFRTIGL